jgi:hypothetical protein
MASQSDYDFVLQLRCDVLRDVQTRVLNASLLTNLVLASPISRVLAQTVSPFQMKAHWAKPELDIGKDVVKLSADVHGGARYAIEGINLTMEGHVNAKCQPVAVLNEGGQPVVTVAAPSPLDLHLGGLKLSYEGDGELPTWVDTAIEHTLLRPTLCAQLMVPLANLPLTCLPDAVPLRLTDEPHGVTPSTNGLALADAAVSLDPHAKSLTLAMRCTADTATPAPPPNLLLDHTTANAVVALSETGLNSVLSWLCAEGIATGMTPRPEGLVSWRWAHVAAAFTDHAIHLTGELWQGETATVVDAELQCSLTSSAQLSAHLTAPDPQPAGAGILIDAWVGLLRRLFYAATRSPEPARSTSTKPYSEQPLLQRFVIPGTDLFTEALAVDLGLRHGYLVALYAVPPDEQPFTLTLEEEKPEPTIIQLDIPRQEAPGAPVTTQLDATLVHCLEPPYDYAWRADQESHPRHDHGPTMTVTKTPPPILATGGPHKLSTVNLKVIDILGQVGEAEVDAMYYPAATPYQETHQDGKKQTAIGLGAGGITTAVAHFYKKWRNRQETTAVLRVTGTVVTAAIVIAVIIYMSFPSCSSLSVPIAQKKTPSTTGQRVTEPTGPSMEKPPPSSPFAQPPPLSGPSSLPSSPFAQPPPLSGPSSSPSRSRPVPPTMTFTASTSTAAITAPVTLSANLTAPLDNSGFIVRLYDQATGGIVKECANGSACLASVSNDSPTTHTYAAYLDNSDPPYSAVSTVTKQVTWAIPRITLSADPTTLSVNDHVTLTAILDMPITSSRLSVHITNVTLNKRVLDQCTQTKCQTSDGYIGGSPFKYEYVAYVDLRPLSSGDYQVVAKSSKQQVTWKQVPIH